MNTCGSCKWWDARYPQAPDLGVCRKMGAIHWTECNEIALVVARDFGLGGGSPTTDFGAVRTVKSFGCNGHSDEPISFL